jgi:hypothetical protein
MKPRMSSQISPLPQGGGEGTGEGEFASRELLRRFIDELAALCYVHKNTSLPMHSDTMTKTLTGKVALIAGAA